LSAEPAVPVNATYVYCVIQSERAPRHGKVPEGLPGLGVCRLLDAGRGLWLVVADAPLPRFGEASVQRELQDPEWVSRCAVAHEAVVEHWLRARAVVPMKLLTIFESDARALADMTRRRRQLDKTMRRVACRREWGVRIRQLSAAGLERPAPRAATGAEYLAAKSRARDADRHRAARGRSRVNLVFRTLSALAVEAERRPPLAGGDYPSRLLLDAAFLVEINRTPRFRATVRRITREWGRAGCGVELTGPWPPYNFIEPNA
jgi:hypothetical protein